MTTEVITTVEAVPIMDQLQVVVLTMALTVTTRKLAEPILLGATISHHLKIGSIAELLDLAVLPQGHPVPHLGTVVQVLAREAEDSVNNHQPRLTTLCNT